MVIGDVLDGGFEEASVRNDTQSNKRSHEVDFAVRQAKGKEIVSKLRGNQLEI